MANIPITAGSGTASVATETVAGISYQQIEVYGGGGSSILGINPDRSINASIIGIPNVVIAGGSVAATISSASVAGAVQLAGASPASIMTVTRLDNQIIGSMLGMVGQVTIHGLTSTGGGSYVDVKVDPSGALVMAGSSVVSFQGGTQITSVVSSTPSSLLAGASIFGQLPAGTAVLGSITALQGTSPWNIAGSVAAVQSGTRTTSIVGGASVFQAGTWNVSVAAANITSIATANGGLPLWSPLTSRIQGTADFRGNSGASIAVIAGAGASTRNYVDHVQVLNLGSASVLVTIADNTTSILGYTIAPAGGGSNYDTLYRGTTNSPITASISGVASVIVSMQGFTSGT